MNYLVIDSNAIHLHFDDLRNALMYVKNNIKEGNFCRVYEIKEVFNTDDFDCNSVRLHDKA